MNKLIFLGTGSGGDVMLTQSVNTSSLYFELADLKFILDPGPGTLVNAKKYKVDLLKLDGVLISHPHPDHYSDVNALLSVFPYSKKEGFLLANKLCLVPSEQFWPVVSKFHAMIPKIVKAMSTRDRVTIGKVAFEATRADHQGCGMGFKIKSDKVSAGYVGNGRNFDGQEKQYAGCNVLIIDTLFPFGTPHDLNTSVHLMMEDVVKFLNKMERKPKLVLIQHFTEAMLRAGIDKQAKLIEKQTGIKTVAARDGMAVDLDLFKIK